MKGRATHSAPDLLPVLRAATHVLHPDELAAPILVGFSGGADSLTLLHLLMRWSAETGAEIHAVIIDHQLRPTAADEAAANAALCAAWGIAATVRVVDSAQLAAGGGVEEGARQERYRLFAEVAQATGARTLALGHQANDQAETVLLHLLRGAGLGGLRGMPLVRRAGDLLDQFAAADAAGILQRPAIWRPLREVSRATIEAYCRAWKLQPIHDESNDDVAFRRNGVRHDLLPAAEQLFPGTTLTLAREADLFAAEDDLLHALTAAAWSRTVTTAGPLLLIDRAAFRAEDLALQRRVLRQAVAQFDPTGAPLGVGARSIEAARVGIVAAESGGQWPLPGGLRLLVERSRAVIGPANAIETALRQQSELPFVSPGWSISVAELVRVPLSAGWIVQRLASVAPANDSASYRLPATAEPLVLRTWQPGDRLLLRNGNSQKLQDWFVDHYTPRYLRGHLVLLAAGQQIFWIAGVAAFASGGAPADGPNEQVQLLYNDRDCER